MFGLSPNIQGGIQSLRGAQVQVAVQGAFNLGVCRSDIPVVTGGLDQVIDLEFLASKSASIYGGSTLQPKALNCLACIRV